jgi:transposase InsO family protein
VARCTVARLLRRLGIRGVVRGRPVKTTIPADKAQWPEDLVERAFFAERPDSLWVSDLTATWRGFAYVAFRTDLAPIYMPSHGGLSVGACRTRSGATSR